MTAPATPQTGESLPVSKVRQWSVMQDGMLLSALAPDGTWLPVRRLGYDDLRLVYRYEVVDWSPVGWVALLWMLLGTISFIVLLLLKVPAEWAAVAVFLELVTLIGAAVYRVLTHKRPMLRFEAYSGELVLPDSNPQFYGSLSQALAASETWRQAAPAPEVTGQPEMHYGAPQPQWQPYEGLPPLWNPNAPSTQPPVMPPPPEWQNPPPAPIGYPPPPPVSEGPIPPPPGYSTPPPPPTYNPPPFPPPGYSPSPAAGSDNPFSPPAAPGFPAPPAGDPIAPPPDPHPAAPGFPPPPPGYSAPAPQIDENPPSATTSADSADATGENERR